MLLYLVRHAIAEPRGSGWEDADRPLTLKGVERFVKCVRGLRRMGVEVDFLYSSPWERAVQTAAELESVLPRGKPIQTESLARSPDESLLALLDADSVALVGHEPWMGEACAWLCTAERSDAEVFPFKKGGVAILEGEPIPGAMVLKAWLPPKVLRRIGKR